MIERRERNAILVITTLAALCRLASIAQPMRFDEAVSWAYYVGRSWDTITGTYRQPNNHVLYSLLAKGVAAGANYEPWALRLPALLAGISIAPLLWAVGRRFADAKSGLLAAALSVGSTQLILYSTNARGYTLVVALFLALLLVANRLAARATLAGWVGFAVVAALGLYTIPVMLYPFGVVAVWLFMSSTHTATGSAAGATFRLHLLLACGAAAVLAGALYAPIINSAGIAALTGNKFVSPSSWRMFVNELPTMIGSTLASWASPLTLWSVPFLGALALIGLRRSSNTRPSLALAALIWCTVLLLVTHRAPFVRVWLFLLPLFLLAVARGVWRVVTRFRAATAYSGEWPAMVVATAMLVIGLTTRAAERLDDTGAFRSAEQVAAILAPRLRAGDRVLAPIPTIGPLLYYFPRVGADTALLTVPLTSANRAFLVLDAHQGQTLDWAVANHVIDPATFAQPKLLARFPDGELWETSPR